MALSSLHGAVEHGRAPSTSIDPFVGRTELLRELDQLVAGGAGGGGARVVLGEPGIGKTALLHRLARHSRARTIWVRGREAETALPYAAAAELVTPVLDHFDVLPPAQRRALETALALVDGGPPNRVAALAGAFGVLAAAADVRPLLVLVDDLEWVDPASRELLLYAACRLSGTRVVMILAAGDEAGPAVAGAGLPAVRLSGLDDQECRQLAERHQGPGSPGRLQALARATGGNPLALLEGLTQPAAVEPDPLRLGPRLLRSWQQRLDQVPEATRSALFLVAAAQPPELAALAGLLSMLGLSLDDLTAAERHGLLGQSDGRLEVRPAVLRAALHQLTPLAARIPVYRALASAADDERRAWYLSMSCVGPDERVAALLEAAAHGATGRGDHRTAARILRRAVELTGAPVHRGPRLLAAASAALRSGDAAQAEHWLGQVFAGPIDRDGLVAATQLRAEALSWLGHPVDARQVLSAVGERLAPEAPELAGRLFLTAALPAALTGDVRAATAVADRGEALLAQARVTASFADQVAAATVRVVTGVGWHAPLCAALQAAAEAESAVHVRALAVLGQASGWAECFDQAGLLVDRALDAARQHGSVHLLAYPLAVRADLGVRSGRWPAARADAEQAVGWATELGQRGELGYALLTVARIEAIRGNGDLARDRVARCRREVGPYGVDWLPVAESAVLGLAALGAGRPEQAAEQLEAAWRVAGRLGWGNPNVVPFVADLAEAQIRCGRPERARVLIDWLEERAAGELAGPAIGAARCRGLLAEDPEHAAAAFEVALELESRCPMPFERARTLLCQGEVLRRGRQAATARAVLDEAEQAFDRLGARPWAARAAAELAAAGAHPRGRGPATGLDLLSPQELQIARLVAAGRNNVETAAALFVSRKTVEAHLTRVYRKLRVRSRNELMALIAMRPADE